MIERGWCSLGVVLEARTLYGRGKGKGQWVGEAAAAGVIWYTYFMWYSRRVISGQGGRYLCDCPGHGVWVSNGNNYYGWQYIKAPAKAPPTASLCPAEGECTPSSLGPSGRSLGPGRPIEGEWGSPSHIHTHPTQI